MEALLDSLRQTRSLRLNCSDLGALTGFHPFVNLGDLFMKYLYQDLHVLQQLDAQTLGIELLSVEEETDAIVSKLDKTSKLQVAEIMEKVAAKENLQSNTQAQTMIANINDLLLQPHIRSQLSPDAVDFVRREFSGKIRKTYGSYCEEKALERYAEITGFPVVERNSKTYILEVMPAAASDGFPVEGNEAVTTPAHEESLMGDERSELVKETELGCDDAGIDGLAAHGGAACGADAQPTPRGGEVIDLTEDGTRDVPYGSLPTPASSTSTSSLPLSVLVPAPVLANAFDVLTAAQQGAPARAPKRRSSSRLSVGTPPTRIKPAFVLVGKVDGVSYQLDTRADNAVFWKETKVVVEMKTRVRRIQRPPPIYEQIQLVAYLTMVQCSQGDLVQYIPQEGCGGVTELDVHRVSLHGPPYHHSLHWETTILPRLHVFRDAVMALRGDDDLRRAFLLAGEEERLQVIGALCPYFV